MDGDDPVPRGSERPPRDRIPLRSVDEVRQAVPRIVRQLEANQPLAVAALANPLLALEELGYDIADEIRPDVERRIRFTEEDAARLDALADEVATHVGHPVEIDDPERLDDLLFRELGLSRPPEARPEGPSHTSVQTAPPPGVKGAGPTRQTHPLLAAAPAVAGRAPTPFRDPLQQLSDAHPVMGPLLAYRQIASKRPPLADRELYARLRSGELSTPVKGVRMHLKRGRDEG